MYTIGSVKAELFYSLYNSFGSQWQCARFLNTKIKIEFLVQRYCVTLRHSVTLSDITAAWYELSRHALCTVDANLGHPEAS